MTTTEQQGFLDGYLYKTAYDLPFDVGDTILAGHFKNQRRVVKGFGTGKHNQPVVITDKGAVSLFPFRVQKLMPKTASLRPWREIREQYDDKEHRHHLRLVCDNCGNEETCRCSSPKTTEHGICFECGEKQRTEQ
jgi:hypothetical protein